MGATVADYNGDGRPDIFKTNFSEDTPTLYRNEGHGTFADVTNVAGLGKHTQYLGWGTMFFDFDNVRSSPEVGVGDPDHVGLRHKWIDIPDANRHAALPSICSSRG